MQLRWNWKRWPLAALALLLAGGNALAHEKWFVDAQAISGGLPVFSRVDATFAAAVIGIFAVLFLAAVWIDRRLDGSRLTHWIDARLASAPFNPRTVLGVTIGVSLMGAGLHGTLFSPSLILGGNSWGIALGIFQITLGALLLFLEPAYAELGFLVAALFLAGLAVVPFWDAMEELFLFGAGLYLMTTGKGRALFHLNAPEFRRRAYHLFRILTGLNFLVLSGVKWFRPELALAIVGEYRLNFLYGLGMSDIQFVFLAAVIETLVALCILFRVAFRPAVLVAFTMFLISIFFLGPKELLGHLPVKATMFMFFVYGHWHKGEQKP
ncbi:MAG: hypothetical protein QY323_02205 [Patescibacteria group bacterium]|nr:MAG: hypothetical protein QY323_02205 [Patescibacteria group bacterium]